MNNVSTGLGLESGAELVDLVNRMGLADSKVQT